MAGRSAVCSPVRLRARTILDLFAAESSDHAVVNVLAIAWLALGLVWAVGFGSRAASVAGARNRRRERWFLFGAVLGPGALAILDAAPPGVCARCLSPVAGWSTTCAACGEDVRANPMIDLMLGSEQLQPPPARAPMAATSPADGPGPRRGPGDTRQRGPTVRCSADPTAHGRRTDRRKQDAATGEPGAGR